MKGYFGVTASHLYGLDIHELYSLETYELNPAARQKVRPVLCADVRMSLSLARAYTYITLLAMLCVVQKRAW